MKENSQSARREDRTESASAAGTPSRGGKNMTLVQKGFRGLRKYGLRETWRLAKQTVLSDFFAGGADAAKNRPQYSFRQIVQFIDTPGTPAPAETPSCTVLIPVYNGYEHLTRLIPSLEKNTPPAVRVLFTDDCSPDERVQELLRQTAERHPDWCFSRSERNRGFTATVNRAMASVTTDYAVWLNTDTEVPALWVERLLRPFSETKDVATVTPFTNSGVLFSFPDFLCDNAPAGELEAVNRAFRCIKADEYGLNETYSGTGFCMAVNMACWREIGPLDEQSFARGYGEENDWCFRARKAGWRHLLAPDLFVNHHHSGSFTSEEKQRLVSEHQAILQERYPAYMRSDVPAFQREDPWCVYRQAAALLLCRERCHIFIDLKKDESTVSGAADFARQYLRELTESGDCRILVLQYSQGTDIWEAVPYAAAPEMAIRLDSISDLETLFEIADVQSVTVNNLAFCENVEQVLAVLLRLKRDGRCRFFLRYMFHDYLSVCPSFFLLDDRTLPCGTGDPERCRSCIKANDNKIIERVAIRRWREMFAAFFAEVDEFRFFSHYARSLVLKVYPEIEPRTRVIYHRPLMSGQATPFRQSEEITELRIAFVGVYNRFKGSDFFAALAADFQERGVPAQFFLVGVNQTGRLPKPIKALGRYRRDDLGEILTENRINLVVYPSINNETFSYVAQELMQLEVPLVVFPCGAPQERIRGSQYALGEVADEVSSRALGDATLRLADRLFFQSGAYRVSDELRQKWEAAAGR